MNVLIILLIQACQLLNRLPISSLPDIIFAVEFKVSTILIQYLLEYAHRTIEDLINLTTQVGTVFGDFIISGSNTVSNQDEATALFRKRITSRIELPNKGSKSIFIIKDALCYALQCVMSQQEDMGPFINSSNACNELEHFVKALDEVCKALRKFKNAEPTQENLQKIANEINNATVSL